MFGKRLSNGSSTLRGLQNHMNHLSPRQVSRFSQVIHGKDCSAWEKLALDLAQSDLVREIALTKAYQLVNSGLKPNAYTLVHLIRAYTSTGLYSHGQQLHGHIMKSGFSSNSFVSSALIHFYVQLEDMHDAQRLFAEIPEPGVVSWNSLITGYVHSGQFRKALRLFLQLENSNTRADSYSFTAALSACGQLSLDWVGKSVHSKIMKHGVECSVFVANCLIDMYGKCGFAAEATRVFQNMVEKDTISWNSVIAANSRNGKLDQAFSIATQMPCPDTISYNELIDGISRYGVIEDAIFLLLKMPNPNSSSWNSIITGFVNRGRAGEALNFFYKMHSVGVCMDHFTFPIILSGIAGLSAATWGSTIHCCVLKYGLERYVVVGSALTDMYFKCGQIIEAERMFESIPEKNLVTWNAVLSGYAHNGNYNKVIRVFNTLKTRTNLQPDEITFLNVLSACWHCRISSKISYQYFEMMVRDYLIDPTPEHCSFMIRILGQEGEVDRAEKMICELGYDSCGIVWKSLLGACAVCGNIEVAEVAAKKLRELGTDDEFVYVMMSNIYARFGKWEYVCGIRELMKKTKVGKEAGRSWIEVEEIT